MRILSSSWWGLAVPRTRRCHVLASVLSGMAFLGTTACAPSSLVDVQSPSTVVDPSTVKTAAGAIALRTSALVQMMYLQGGVSPGGVIAISGMLTDELDCTYCGVGYDANLRRVSVNDAIYNDIHTARVRAHIAREGLLAYGTNSPAVARAWQGELYALEGYAVLSLAELYCSGIPLTTVPFVGAPTPTPGLTTQELFARAIALFDSAAVLSGDSVSYLRLAQVGKGRALLGLGQFAAADSAVANVPMNFVYVLRPDSSGTTIGYNVFPGYERATAFRIADREGQNGLVWSTDPRIGAVERPAGSGYFWPAKYNITGSGQLDPTADVRGVPIRLADGLEAQLIHAEAALARGDGGWLTLLNELRATCIGTTACAPVPGLTSASLAPLNDPGTDTARVSLVMRERAMWLYLTGHREGDLRRLARIYHRPAETLWPTGAYTRPEFSSLNIPGIPAAAGHIYGSATVFVPPTTEQANNALYGGCYDQNP